jgi:hypothetical protein
MDLPWRTNAIVPPEKLTAYLLSLTHPVGRSKARFFRKLGFTAANADRLQSELLRIAQSQPVTIEETTSFGRKYVIDGRLVGPGGDTEPVRTIWILESDQYVPRFITAYPRE